jgi:hypothetical protein
MRNATDGYASLRHPNNAGEGSFLLLYCNNIIICTYKGKYTVRDSKSSKSIFYVNNKIACARKVKIYNKQKVDEIYLDIKNRMGH